MIVNISIEYNEKEKELYIAEESSSGCIYLHIEKEDISSYVKSYVDDLIEEVSWLPLYFVPGRIVKILIIKKSVDKVKEVCYTLTTIRKGNKRFTNF